MQQKIKIKDRYIGEGEPLYLIAEIGINHNGDMQIAKKLMDATWATGWDCVKFQKRTPDLCVPENQKNIIRETPWGNMTYLEYRNKIEFEKDDYDSIDKYCTLKPLDWTASVWDIPSIDFLLQYDVPFIKIPSAKITDLKLVEKCAKSSKPVFLSTGMSTIEEIDKAVEILEKSLGKNYVLFHTNSSYPSKLEELNLAMIKTLKDRYNCVVGYSGHEYEAGPTTLAPIFGASIIERHITLSHELWGSDQKASLEIGGMALLKKRIEITKLVVGDGIKKISKDEEEIRKKLRG